jgi:hypothetical protein
MQRELKNVLATLMLAGICATLQHCAVAEESKDDAEAKQAAKEEDDEKKLPEDRQFGKPYSGTFSLYAADPNQPNPQVVGTFTVDNGPTLLVKLNEPTVLKRLTVYDNKKCVLLGKLRNNGKYIVVSSVIEQAPTPAMRRKRGGM